MMYTDKLRAAAEAAGNISCMGLDPVIEGLPHRNMRIAERLGVFFEEIFSKMKKSGVVPAAFKPNIGYYRVHDRPREGDFSGSRALADLLALLRTLFPEVPVILDGKWGDIARSSVNYAVEGFDIWDADAVTVAPYMGTDSAAPFVDRCTEKGAYILLRTSNPGAADFQDLPCRGGLLYETVAEALLSWSVKRPGVGAVVGATSPEELERICRKLGENPLPLLIPGVGGQGGDAGEVGRRLKAAGYDRSLVRINSSSGITHPWVKEGRKVPDDWADEVVLRLKDLTGKTSLSPGRTG